MIVFAPQNAAACARLSLGRIDADRFEPRKIDDNAAIAHRASRHIVPAAADRNRHPPIACEPDRRHHIRHSRRADDRFRPPVDHGIPHLPRFMVSVAVRQMNRTPDHALQCIPILQFNLRRHSVIPPVRVSIFLSNEIAPAHFCGSSRSLKARSYGAKLSNQTLACIWIIRRVSSRPRHWPATHEGLIDTGQVTAFHFEPGKFL